jgi:hypothetical protein
LRTHSLLQGNDPDLKRRLTVSNQNTLGAVRPPEMAERMENVGVKEAQMGCWSMLVLAVLAGAFVGLGPSFLRS